MNPVAIGNLISLVGCSLMVLIGFIRKKETILTLQCFQFGIQGIANLVLGGVTGFISAVISIARNLVFSKIKSSRALKLAFILIQVALSVNALGNGVIDWLPVLAAAILTWFIDTRSEVTLKNVIMGTAAIWLIYDLSYRNYISAAFDAFTILSNFVGILMLKRKPL